MSEEILVTVVCDDYKEGEFPLDEKLEVTGFGAHSFLEGKMQGGLMSTRTIWWMGYASSKEDAIDKCKKNWAERENKND